MFRTKAATSIVLVALIWMIIQTVQLVCDEGNVFAGMSWKSIIIASVVLFVLFFTIVL